MLMFLSFQSLVSADIVKIAPEAATDAAAAVVTEEEKKVEEAVSVADDADTLIIPAAPAPAIIEAK